MPTDTDWLAGAVWESTSTRRRGGRPCKPPRKDGAERTRMRKIHCEACGVILYGSAAALTRSGLPICGCGEPMTVANLRDRAIIEWDALAAELESHGSDAWNAAMRELGYADLVLATDSAGRLASRERRSGAAPARCQWEGGYCMKFTSGRYCPEHGHERPEMGSAHKGR